VSFLPVPDRCVPWIKAFFELYKNGRITKETAINYAMNPEMLRRRLGCIFSFGIFLTIKNPSQAYHLKRIFLLLIFVSDQISALFASETFFYKNYNCYDCCQKNNHEWKNRCIISCLNCSLSCRI